MAPKKIDRKPDLLVVMEKAKMDLSAVSEDRPTVQLRCPFHEDHGRPNFTLWRNEQRWRCFRCGIGGDVYDFIGFQIYGRQWNNRERDMFKAVLERIETDQIPEVSVAPAPPPVAKEVAAAVSNVMVFASRVYYLSMVSHPKAQFVRDYLAERGIDLPAIRMLRLGYVIPGMLSSALAQYPASVRQAAECTGLFHRDEEAQIVREFLSGRIVFPDLGQGGKVLGMVGRDTVAQSNYRYLSLPGIPKTLYRLDACSKNLPIILTESMVDTANLWQMGFQGVGANGTGIAWYQIERLKQYPIICILPQNDDAGREAVERWKVLLPQARLLNIPYKGGDEFEKDVNDMFRPGKRGKEETRQVITSALKEVGITM